MRRNRALIALLALVALGVSLSPLADPAQAARRRGARFNAQVASLYTRACTDGIQVTIADLDPPERNPATLVGSLARVDPLGETLTASVELAPQAAPIPVAGNATDYGMAGVGVLRPRAGEPWLAGDRVTFSGAENGARHVATVQPCSLAEPAPEVFDYLPVAQPGPILVDDEVTIGAVRVALNLSYAPPAAAPLRLTLFGPGGRAVTLLDLEQTDRLDLGLNFNDALVEGGQYTTVFDAASSFALADASAASAYSDVAIRPADAAAMRALFGAPAAGEWRLVATGADDTPIPGESLGLSWRLEIVAASRVYLPLVASGLAEAPQALTIYDNSLASGWETAGSYGATVDLAATARAVSAPNAIGVTFTEAYGGLTFRAAEPVAAAGRYSAIALYVWGAPGGSPLSVYSYAADDGPPGTVYNFTAPGGAWTEVTVPLSDLGSPDTIARFTLQDESGAPGATIYVDDVRLAP